MKKHFLESKGLKRIATVALSAILAAGMLAGCGKGGSGEGSKDGKTEKKDPSELVYVADYIPIDYKIGQNDYMSFYDAVITDTSMMTIHSIYDDATDVGKSTLVEFDIESGSLIREVSFPEELEGIDPTKLIPEGHDVSEFDTGVSITRFAALPDGTFVAIFYVYANEKIPEGEEVVDNENIIYKTRYAIVLLDKDLNITSAKELDFPEIEQGDANLSNLFVDAKGNIGVTIAKYDENGNSFILALVDSNCEITQKIPLQINSIDNCFLTNEGNLMVTYYDNNWNIMTGEFDLQNGSFGEPLKEMPDYYTSVGKVEGDDQKLLIASDDILYRYSKADGSKEELLKWSDVDIKSDSVQRLIGKEDGTFFAVLYSWNTGKTEIARISQKKRGDLAEKKDIIVATLYEDYALSSAAIEFNKANSDYHVTVKEYYNWENEDADLEDARKTMINDLGGAADIDIVNMSDFSTSSLVKQNVVDDITPFLTSGGKLNISDYNESVLNCYKFDGKLVAIPKTYYLTTLAVKKDLIPAESWTVKDMIEFDKAHPEMALMDYSYRMSILQLCLYNNMDYFVDPETGDCRFDSDEFKEILEYVGTYPEEIDWEHYDDSESEIEKVQNHRVIAENVYLYNLQSVQEYTDYVFRGEANFIGYPTISGEAETIIEPSGAYGICTASKQKEDAWKFIEYVLTSEMDNDYGFPANNKDLQKLIDKELEKAGQKTGAGVGWGGTDEVYEYHYATQEEIDLFYEMLGKAVLSPATGGDQEIFNIIEEEIESYFSGQKSVDEVAKVIQSRVNLYVKENM